MFTLLLTTSVGKEMEVKKREQNFEDGNWAPFEESIVKALLEVHILVIESRGMVLA